MQTKKLIGANLGTYTTFGENLTLRLIRARILLLGTDGDAVLGGASYW